MKMSGRLGLEGFLFVWKERCVKGYPKVSGDFGKLAKKQAFLFLD